MIYRLLFIFSVGIAFVEILNAQEVKKHPRIPLDVHVHHYLEVEEVNRIVTPGGEWTLAADVIEFSLLISSSYQINGPGDQPPPDDVPLELRDQWHRDLSNFIVKHPGRFAGLCGISSQWPDAVAVLNRCLQLPGMKGIKIHSFEERGLVHDLSTREKFSRLFESVKDRNLVVLWHVFVPHRFQYDSEGSPEELLRLEIENIVALAQQFKSITFILAHSLEGKGGELLKGLSSKLDNLYLEISVPYVGELEPGVVDYRLNPEIVKVWKDFDIKRVLFGSDMGFFLEEAQTQLIQSIQESDLLSDYEKERILFENSKAFLSARPWLKQL